MIRQAQVSEFEKVLKFYYDLIDDMENDPYSPLWQKNVYPEDETIQSAVKNGWLYIMEEDEKIIGSMVINSNCTNGYEKVNWNVSAHGNDIGVIHLLGIAKERQGKGTGSLLVQGAIDICRKMGKKTIRLDAVKRNLPAQHLYEKNGFNNCGVVKLYYEDTGWMDFVMYDYIL